MVCRETATGRDQALTPRLKAFVSVLGLAAVAGLVLLHATLLWDRVASGSLGEPAVALRWLAALVLVAALVALRRRGVPLLWGRRALVFWLLVLLLHAGAGVPHDPAARVVPEQLLFVVPAAVAPAALALALVVTLLAGARAAAPRRAWVPRADECRASLRRRGFPLALASRPPPA